jgi:hypothetical protein
VTLRLSYGFPLPGEPDPFHTAARPVERTHSWFHNFRRTIIRYEMIVARDTGGIHLAGLLLTLRRF